MSFCVDCAKQLIISTVHTVAVGGGNQIFFSIAIIVKPVFEFSEVVIDMQLLVRSNVKASPLDSLTNFKGHIQ
jgi:hypothetical protein